MIAVSPVVTSTLPVLEDRPLTQKTKNGFPDLSQLRFSGTDDAVEVELKSKLSDAKQSESSIQDSGTLLNALKSVKSVAEEMKQMQSLLLTVAPGTTRAASIQQEIDNLTLAYQQTISDKNLRRGMDLLSSVQSSLASGASGDALTKALKKEQSLLGESVLGYASNGNLGQLSTLSSSLNDLTSIDMQLPSSADLILSSVGKAMDAFSAPSAEAASGASALPEGELRMISAPAIKHMSFGAAKKLSIGLRTLAPADMIKAAAAHMDLGLDRAIILIGPEDNRENQSKSEEAEEQKQKESRGEQQPSLGLFYGDNAPIAAMIDPSETKQATFQGGTADLVTVNGT